jgi:nitrate reductase (cytochrome), electron transfer subunit
MRHGAQAGGDLHVRIALIALAAAGMAALLVALDSAVAGRTDAARLPTAAVPMHAPAEPIAAEALVFRTRAGELALDPHAQRRTAAHPRTLATFRALRAYPGAPPRVPHGLTADEFRGTGCNTCHERGGFSARFAAYVPVTPHPELADCLQCHASDAAIVGTPLPGAGADAVCRQCHVTPGAAAAAPVLDWRPAAWPVVRGAAADGSPPPIPHELQLRGNCLACHMGPGAVSEVRTAHPERANCRQCHVTAETDDSAYTRTPYEAGER